MKKPDVELTEEEVHAYLNEHVAPHKKLRGGIEFIDAIPKSLSGKILRRELKQREVTGDKSGSTLGCKVVLGYTANKPAAQVFGLIAGDVL